MSKNQKYASWYARSKQLLYSMALKLREIGRWLEETFSFLTKVRALHNSPDLRAPELGVE